MIRRLLPYATAVCGAIVVLSFHPAVFAQTKPSIKVPAEEPSQARAMVQQLLKEGRIIRASDVHRGMRGVARSVFQGTKIEEFPIEILGVLTKANGGGDIVLIKVLGGPVVQRQSGIIAGMSGSPVYIDGKMLGAIALGWGFPKEPIGGVTPITQMIEGALPDNSRRTVEPNTKPASNPGQASTPVYRPRQPLQVAGHNIQRMVVSRDRRRLALSGTPGAATMTMRPVATLLQLSGFSEATLPHLKSVLEPYGIEPVIGPASRKTGVKAPFQPGAAIGVQLVSGDMDQTAVGTVTFRWGKRVLAFGHPMFGQGAASLPMTSAYVHEIFPSYQRSFKMASPIAVVGALQQDTQFAIGGTVGVTADMIPMQVNLRDPERHIARTYKVRVMKDPVLTPQLILSVAAESIESALGETSDKMVRIGLRLDIDNAPSVVRRNYIYANSVVTMAALGDLAQSLAITQLNEFAKGSIRRVNLDVALEPVRRTARIKQVVANRNKIKAGETVQVNVVLEPTDTPDKPVTHTFSFTVPADAPNGVMRIAAGRGADYWPLQARAGGPLPQPTNLRELVETWGQVGSFNELVVEASTPQTFLKVDRQKITGPAPSWARLLRGPGATSIAAFNEVDARRVPTSYMLTGSQFLTIPIESQRHRDKNAPAGATPAPPAEAGDAGATPPDKTPEPGGPPNSGGDLPDDPDNAYYTAGRLDLVRLYQSAPFLRQVKAWRLADPKADPKEPPARDKPDKPIVPAITAPNATPTPTPSPAPGVTPTATPSPTPPAGKIIGRPAQSWVQTSPTDFLSGDFERTFVTAEGMVRLAPPSRLLATTAEPFVWSIAADNKNNVYLGTGHNARILKIDADGNPDGKAEGKQTVFYNGSEVAVTALTSDATGNLYAGVTPGGKLYRFAPDGTRTLIFDAAQSFIWALEWDALGRLLIATGGGEGNTNGGRLYRLSDAATRSVITGTPTTDALKALEVARVPQNHIRCLAVQGDDIYAGAGDDGVLYRINGASGAVAALYQVQPAAGKAALPTEVLAVAIAPEGVYFGTSTNGTVYRWNKESGVIALYASPQQTVYALRRAPDGKLYAATGETGVVYQIAPGHDANDTNAARLLEPAQLQSLALGLTPGGDLLVGTGNNGAAYQVALRDTVSGTFTSNVFDAKNVVRWGALRTVGRGVLIETRSGNTLEPDASWSDWAPAIPNEAGELQVAAPPARYLQYRARLFDKDAAAPPNATPANGVTPGLARVEVMYRAKNSPPSVSFSAPQGGEFWNAKKKLTWTAKDPDSDTLRYRLWLSDDDGKTWQPLPITDNDASSFELDTSKWRDGVYRFKVEASDAVRNPEDPQHDSALSLPVTLDNTAPRIAGVSLDTTPDGVRVQANVSDDLSPIVGVEWRLVDAKPEPKPVAKTDAKPDAKPEAKSDAKPASGTPAPGAPAPVTPAKDKDKDETDDWHALAAADGIFDSKRETVTALATAPAGAIPTGGRKLELRAHDAAGNSTTTTVPWP